MVNQAIKVKLLNCRPGKPLIDYPKPWFDGPDHYLAWVEHSPGTSPNNTIRLRSTDQIKAYAKKRTQKTGGT